STNNPTISSWQKTMSPQPKATLRPCPGSDPLRIAWRTSLLAVHDCDSVLTHLPRHVTGLQSGEDNDCLMHSSNLPASRIIANRRTEPFDGAVATRTAHTRNGGGVERPYRTIYRNFWVGATRVRAPLWRVADLVPLGRRLAQALCRTRYRRHRLQRLSCSCHILSILDRRG